MTETPLNVTFLFSTTDEENAEELDGLARQLRQELAEMPFVDEVALLGSTAVPVGAKGIDGLVIGALTLSLLAGSAPALAAALHHWWRRGDHQRVTIQAQVGDRILKLEMPAGAMSPEQLQQIVATISGAAAPPTSVVPSLAQLGRQLDAAFTLAELQLLAAELALEWENVPGTTRLEKAYALVNLCQQHGRLDELMELCQRERPNITLTH